MNVALVYDRVNKWGGAERVLLALHEMFPDAPLYTSVYDADRAPWARVFPKIYTSFIQQLPWAPSHHELLAPLMPFAFEQFGFDDYDIVISVTSEAAKGIITKPKTLHICYCLTPTRYLWSGYQTYFSSSLFRWLSKPLVSYLRKWDQVAAKRPDVMVGISQEVAGRIKRYYGREAKVIYPPVDLLSARGPAAVFPPRTPARGPLLGGPPSRVTPRSSYFLLVSRLVPYKRIDLAVEAFNTIGLPLVIVGTGSEGTRLRNMARSNIHFVSYLTDGELARYYEKATALIFPQEEDFGMTAVEAQSMGTPIIAYKSGGATEVVLPHQTGEFFWPQTANALATVVTGFDPTHYNGQLIVKHSQQFSKGRFMKEFGRVVDAYGSRLS